MDSRNPIAIQASNMPCCILMRGTRKRTLAKDREPSKKTFLHRMVSPAYGGYYACLALSAFVSAPAPSVLELGLVRKSDQGYARLSHPGAA
jgi:hypothetical protein